MKDVLNFLNDGHNFFGVIVLVAIVFSGIVGIIKAFRKRKDSDDELGNVGKRKLRD